MLLMAGSWPFWTMLLWFYCRAIFCKIFLCYLHKNPRKQRRMFSWRVCGWIFYLICPSLPMDRIWFTRLKVNCDLVLTNWNSLVQYCGCWPLNHVRVPYLVHGQCLACSVSGSKHMLLPDIVWYFKIGVAWNSWIIFTVFILKI